MDLDTPRLTEPVADALDSDTGPHDQSPVPTLDTAALPTEARRADRTVRSIPRSWPASEVREFGQARME